AVAWAIAPERAGAEPALQPIDQRREAGVGGILETAAAEACLLRRQRLDQQRRQTHVLDPEIGIDAVEPLDEEPRQMPGIAARLRGSDLQRRHRAVEAIEGEREPARAHALLLHPAAERLGERGGGG